MSRPLRWMRGRCQTASGALGCVVWHGMCVSHASFAIAIFTPAVSASKPLPRALQFCAMASAPAFSQRRAPASQSAAQSRSVAAQGRRGPITGEIAVFAEPVPVHFDTISSLSVASLDYTLLVRATKTHGVWKTKNGAHIRAIEVEDVSRK
eukprot:551787-Pyramimonas_sp.AAC.1